MEEIKKSEELMLLEHFDAALEVDEAYEYQAPIVKLARLHAVNMELMYLLSHFETLVEYCKKRIPFRPPYHDVDLTHWSHTLEVKMEKYLASFNLSIGGLPKVSVGCMPLTDGVGLALYDRSDKPMQVTMISGNGVKFFPQTEDALRRVGSNKVAKEYAEPMMNYAGETMRVSLNLNEVNTGKFNFGMKTFGENAEKLPKLLMELHSLLHDHSDNERLMTFLQFAWDKYHEPQNIFIGFDVHEKSISSNVREKPSTYRRELLKFLTTKKKELSKYNKLFLSVDSIFFDEDGNDYEQEEMFENLALFLMENSTKLTDEDCVDLFNYVQTKAYIDQLVNELAQGLEASKEESASSIPVDLILETLQKGGIQVTQNFNAPVGQVIGKVDKIETTKE